MSEDIPDWLQELSPFGGEEAAPSQEPPEPESAAQEEVNVEPAVDDLRQMVAMEESPPREKSRPRQRSRDRRSDGGMLPWQRLVLAVLLFLDVAVVGMMFLIMLGRMVIP